MSKHPRIPVTCPAGKYDHRVPGSRTSYSENQATLTFFNLRIRVLLPVLVSAGMFQCGNIKNLRDFCCTLNNIIIINLVSSICRPSNTATELHAMIAFSGRLICL
jgi:hypothetical protein